MIMGYAVPKGHYHKGPKKDTRKRKFNKPTFKPTNTAEAAKPMAASDDALIKVLAQMSDHDMTAFVTATAHPNPTDVVIVNGSNGRPKPIVLDDTDSRQTHSGMVYVALGGFGGGGATHHGAESAQPIVAVPTFKPTAVKVKVEPTNETGEKVIGNIVRKPNGEIVLRFF
jgi:hypothetical protein